MALPVMPAMLKAQTSKQAKASYKARGRPSTSEQETKQLQRSIELESRAERIREQQKRKNAASKAKLERARFEKLERDRLQMGSQRRTDRFGYKSSQMHLGAFLVCGVKRPVPVEEPATADFVSDEEDFGDDGVDDELLMSAMEKTTITHSLQQRSPLSRACLDALAMPPPLITPAHQRASEMPPPLPPKARNEVHSISDQDLDLLCDALESSTQVARELESSNERPESSGSDSFDLSVEDVERLDRLGSVVSAPDPSTSKFTPTVPSPDGVPTKGAAPPNSSQRPGKCLGRQGPVSQIHGSFRSASSLLPAPELGITMSQLESFVDEDLQLTQAISR